MNRKDLWVMGLLALAYLYLDAQPEAVATAAPVEPARPLPVLARARTLLPAHVVPRGVCPRNLMHRVSLRGDGALWCHACDEGFFPEGTILRALTGLAAA
jgi:hypothetical protein